mgnify:CR=1 FL=1
MIDLRIFANRMPGRRSTGLFNYIDKTLMADNKRIKTALVSVFHKDGLDEILRLLHNHGGKFLSTGGTKSFIDGLGYDCEAVEDLTGYPSILGGRVKTLHPKVFGGILNRRDNAGDQEQIKQYEIPEIDLVIVDLYPFEETVASGASEADIIEKIDIGGISLIRAAAKNYNDVVIVASKHQYAPLCEILKQNGDAVTSLADRRFFAKEAFGVSSAYDSAIFNYFDAESDSDFHGCHPQAQQRLRHRLLQSSSLFPHWAMPGFIFSFLYLLFLFFARKAEPEVAVAVVWSAVDTVRHTTDPRIEIVAATTVHTAGTR